ncbi:MAG: carbamoyl phosphate synthase, partial [Candidatus Eremiobacteraeota bacterium]|nr:carbamoyl phosphate synthase [Candidatus Eremiobacteraeota bacterium]
KAAEVYGLPLALKASGGGGGKGLKVARTLDDIPSAFATAQREAEAYFKDATIYAERFLDDPKHIELQILADKHGNVVHVGERDCSLQRRHQKLWEEAPAVIPENVRGAIREAGIRAAQAIGYDSAGTIETLVAGDEFFFLEMNTRIQVEHTVSEMLSGLDLVAEQIRIAAGEPLGYAQDAIALRGHAIEVRINAEDPARDFQPAPGTITRYEEAGGLGVRVDSAAFEGFTISPDYDSLIAKLVVWAPSRPSAIARLRRALDEFAIDGVATTIPLLRALCDESVVINNEYGTATLEPLAAEWAKRASQVSRLPLASRLRGPSGPYARSDKQREDAIHVEVNGRLFTVRMLDQPAARDQGAARPARRKPPLVGSAPASSVPNDAVVSPMHGIVVQIAVKAGDSVEEGALLLVLEAMKMMNEIRATRAGSIASVRVQSGQTVEAGTELITYA